MPAFSATNCRGHLVASRMLAAGLVIAVVASFSNRLRGESPPATPPIIILIGGNHSDPSPEQRTGNAGRGGNSGLWRLKQDLHQQDGLQAEYFNWNGTRAGHIDAARPGGAQRIARRIRQLRAQRPQAAVVLVGNSWGGHTAWQVCRLLEGGTINERLGSQQSINGGAPQPPPRPLPTHSIDLRAADEQRHDTDEDADSAPEAKGVIAVELLVLLDPSSFGRGSEPMPRGLPANVKRAVNYHTRNSFGWCGWLQDARLECIDLGDPQHGYLVADGPQYDSPLSWTAHVAAEWDERIHLAIRRRIIGTLQTAASSSASGSAPSADERLRRRE